MLGAYLGFTTVALSGWFGRALGGVPPVVGVLGAFLEPSTLRFISGRPPIYQLLLTFGLALILEESIRVLYGPTAKGVEPPPLLQGAIDLGGVLYPRYRLFLVVLGCTVGVAVWLFLSRTRAGLVIRAVAQNSEMADCLGADVARVRTLVFGAACALAGLGGVAAAPMTTAYLGMGITVIVDAFVGVVIRRRGQTRRRTGGSTACLAARPTRAMDAPARHPSARTSARPSPSGLLPGRCWPARSPCRSAGSRRAAPASTLPC